jgi:hypothetical protein
MKKFDLIVIGSGAGWWEPLATSGRLANTDTSTFIEFACGFKELDSHHCCTAIAVQAV